MKRFRKVVSVGCVAVTAILGTVVAGAEPASAAGCYGYSCHGHDPVAEGCVVSSTTMYTAPEAVVYNHYSNNCNANWIQASLTRDAYNAGESMVLLITTTDSHGHLESMCYPGPSNTGALNEYCYETTYRGTAFAYSDMVDGTNRTAAVGYLYSDGKIFAEYEADQ